MDHVEEHFTSSELIKDIVIGMSDGLTVPFALAAGLSGAVHNNAIIITAGIAEIIAGSIAMGLGGYLAGRTEFEHYYSELKKEYYEVDHLPDVEKKEVADVFAEYGLSEESQQIVVADLAKDPDKWVDFMMRFELGLEKPDVNRAKKSAANIAISYIVGGLIPLFPYLITQTPQQGLVFSIIITILALCIFGYFKSRITGQPPFAGALKTAAIGALAAGAAFIIAKIIT
jgi:VIT1/CCC1 family predicted Fe2+/Mn2+ transporter